MGGAKIKLPSYDPYTINCFDNVPRQKEIRGLERSAFVSFEVPKRTWNTFYYDDTDQRERERAQARDPAGARTPQVLCLGNMARDAVAFPRKIKHIRETFWWGMEK